MGTRILETLFTEPGTSPEDDAADADGEPKQPTANVATPSRRT